MAPVLAPERREERRSQIIQAAWRSVARKPFHRLTVDDVCDEAGLSKGAFYGYFESKQELLVALLEDEAAGRLAQLGSLRGIGLERLEAFARAMLERGEDPARVQVLADLWAMAASEPSVGEALSASVTARRTLLRDWVDAAVDDELLVDLPPNALASILIALGDGLILHAALDPTAFQWRNVAAVLVLLLEGLRR